MYPFGSSLPIFLCQTPPLLCIVPLDFFPLKLVPLPGFCHLDKHPICYCTCPDHMMGHDMHKQLVIHAASK